MKRNRTSIPQVLAALVVGGLVVYACSGDNGINTVKDETNASEAMAKSGQDCAALIKPGGVPANADAIACYAKDPAKRGVTLKIQRKPSVALQKYEGEIAVHTLGAATAQWLHDCHLMTDAGRDNFMKAQTAYVLSSKEMADGLRALTPDEAAASDAAWEFSAENARKTLRQEYSCDSPNNAATAGRALVSLEALYEGH